MRKHFLLIAILVVNLSMLKPFTSLADWEKNATGWWYQENDRSYPLNCWKEIKGKWYYFNQDGYMSSNTVTPDGYRVGADGAWIQSNSYIYENKMNELQNLMNDPEEKCQFIIEDLNSDGIDELIAEIYVVGGNYVRVWTYQNGNIKELNVPETPFSRGGYTKGAVYFYSTGHSSHESYAFYKLNSNFEFELATGVTWENGAWNGLGHDTYYIDDMDLNHVKEIDKSAYEYLLNNYLEYS